MASAIPNHVSHHPSALGAVGSGLRTFSGVLSLVILAISLATLAAALLVPDKPAFAFAGMQLVSAFAAAFGLLWARGAFAASPGLAMACIAMSIALCSLLSYVSFRGQLGPIPMKLWFVGLLALSLVQLGVAAVSILGRNLAGWPLFWRASVFGLGTMLGCSVFVSPVSSVVEGWASWAKLGIQAFAAVFAAICVCAAVHLAVAAFESSHTRD